jgi:hypothetical protein
VHELLSGGGCPAGTVPCSTTSVAVARRNACTDVVGWADPDGYTCADWSNNAWCSSTGTAGSNWNPAWGLVSSYEVNGVGPDDACCACGGGSGSSTSTEALTTTLTTTATTTPKPTDPPCPTDPLAHFTEYTQRKALNNPLGIDLTCTLNECALQCYQQEQCLTFTYRPSNSKCLLKLAVPENEVWVVSRAVTLYLDSTIFA